MLTTADTEAAPQVAALPLVNANGAVAGVDYSGNPADPTTWTALTTSDVIADRINRRTVTMPGTTEHVLQILYAESAAGPTAKLELVENHVFGRDIERVTRVFRGLPIDPDDPPAGVTEKEIADAPGWAQPGETVVVGQLVERSLVGNSQTPTTTYLDTNRWEFGVDVLGDPEDMSTWYVPGPDDVYFDLYHLSDRVGDYTEIVTNLLVTAPTDHVPSPRSDFQILSGPGIESPLAVLGWNPPFGFESKAAISGDLATWTPSPILKKSIGSVSRHFHLIPTTDASARRFFRVTRQSP